LQNEKAIENLSPEDEESLPKKPNPLVTFQN
jgi:hypothetical protein